MANTASGSATVGVQAEAIHGDVNLYYAPPDATPAETFELGLRYLSGGMPEKARECVGDAVARGYVTSRSCFYLVLAMVSGRTVQQMTDADLTALRSLRGRLSRQPRDAWTDAAGAVMRLIDSLESHEQDPRILIKELEELAPAQRIEITRHLEIFLHGPLQDWIWQRAFDQARRDQRADNRTERVWKFFHPRPARARVRVPRPAKVDLVVYLRCAAASIVLALLTAFVAWAAWQQDWPITLSTLAVVVGAAVVSARTIAEWRFRTVRRGAKDRALLPRQRRPVGAVDGFTRRIERSIDRYFGRYVPGNADRADWLAFTSGIRAALRDELAELYRESRISARRVDWLIRFTASEVKSGWQEGHLWEYRTRLRIPAHLKVLCVLAIAVVGGGLGRIVAEAVESRPFSAIGATVVGLLAGWAAIRDGLGIFVEHRRFAADVAEAEDLLEARVAAYERWCQRLADKPSDLEMARWLDCDRKVLMDDAMRHYKLAPRNLVAHAFIEAPAPGRKQARVRNGPWRFSRYRLLIFLLTEDGVRQMTVESDFEKARFHGMDRLNYRFDAVAAVQVAEADDGHKTFELTLVNGHPIEAVVTAVSIEPHEDERSVSRVTLDAAGLSNTLHVLEGIAAEGKQWIHHERLREEGRLGKLASAVHEMLE
ncbi:hypothetical protein [Dactylosporangium salmoneum]|uniref:hypothetical protein n=1 Tax=Dactylosporangium salmoneum TaxID=53361 RepID=UPI0031D8576D